MQTCPYSHYILHEAYAFANFGDSEAVVQRHMYSEAILKSSISNNVSRGPIYD